MAVIYTVYFRCRSVRKSFLLCTAVKALVLFGSLYKEKSDFRKATELHKQSLNTLQQILLIYVDTADGKEMFFN